MLRVNDQPLFVNAGLPKYAATSGRGFNAVVLVSPTYLPSTKTSTSASLVPSSQSAAQPIAVTISPGCTIDDPAALVTLSTHPIGGRFAVEIEKVADPLNAAVAPVESIPTAVTA